MDAQITNIISKVDTILFTYHALDIAIFVFLISGILLGLAKKTWFNLTHIVVFFVFFTIAWFAITPIMDNFVGNDLLKLVTSGKGINLNFEKELFSVPVGGSGISSLSNIDMPMLGEGVSMEITGDFTASIKFSFKAETFSELFAGLICLSPFVDDTTKLYFIATGGVPTETCKQIVDAMINSIAWGFLIILVFIATELFSWIVYLILKGTCLKKIRKRWDSRLVGAALGAVVPMFCVFIGFQCLGVWAGSFEFMKYALEKLVGSANNVLKSIPGGSGLSDSINSIKDQYQPVLSLLSKITDPKQLSICFGWMAGNGGFFGRLKINGEDIQAGLALKYYFESLLGGSDESSLLSKLSEGDLINVFEYIKVVNREEGNFKLSIGLEVPSLVMKVDSEKISSLIDTYINNEETMKILENAGISAEQVESWKNLSSDDLSKTLTDLMPTIIANEAGDLIGNIIGDFNTDEITSLLG